MGDAAKLELADARVAIVMPAYNEADGIEEFLAEIQRTVAPRVGKLTLVVVDDCSTDETAQLLDALASSIPGLVSTRNAHNLGHGPTSLAAYRRGLETGAELVVHVDGDGQFIGDDVLAVVDALASGHAAVVGIREGRTDPWYRKALSRGLSAYLYVLAQVRPHDPNCPLRGYRRATLIGLLDDLPEQPMVPSVYLSVLERRRDVGLLNVPVHSRPRRGTTEAGSTWGTKRSVGLPPRRLVQFVGRAAWESVRTIPRLGRATS
jgi:dolichol-phosphate mannosyltransferase